MARIVAVHGIGQELLALLLMAAFTRSPCSAHPAGRRGGSHGRPPAGRLRQATQGVTALTTSSSVVSGMIQTRFHTSAAGECRGSAGGATRS
jgi:hypothetical protein